MQVLWSDTFNTTISENKQELNILCGNLLQKEAGKWKLTAKSWISEKERAESCGHFIGLEYNSEGIKFYNDEFGLRELYYYQESDGTFYFATRVDILLKWKQVNEIKWDEFGSYWLNRDPLGNGYFIKGINRLKQAGRLKVTTNKLEKTNRLWTAGKEKGYNKKYIKAVIEELIDLVKAPNNSGFQTEFALSGGYDSRSLLALLLHSKADFEAVTWGEEDHPDVMIARELAEITGIKHKLIYRDLLAEDRSWADFYEYCGRTQLVVLGTAIFELHHIMSLIKRKCFWMVDVVNLSEDV